MTKRAVLLLVVPALLTRLIAGASACTAGGAKGGATCDGRPLIYKVSDEADYKAYLEIYTGGPYKYLAEASGGGINEHGFAAHNTTASMLGGEVGIWPRYIIPYCASLADARSELAAQTGGSAAQPMMDRYGGVAMFEVHTSPHTPRYWEYNLDNASRQTDPDYPYDNDKMMFFVRANDVFTNLFHREPTAVLNAWTSTSHRNRYINNRAWTSNLIQDVGANNVSGPGITLNDLVMHVRHGEPRVDTTWDTGQICHPVVGSAWWTTFTAIDLGVNAGENPKFATMLTAMGNPDYSIHIPAWCDLAQSELSPYAVEDSDKICDIAQYSYAILTDRAEPEHSATYDDYVYGVFDAVELNILEAVRDARHQWLDLGNTTNSHTQMKWMHQYSAKAAYYTLKSIYETTAADRRGANHPPSITALGSTGNGLNVTFDCNASDGDGIAYYRWRFGDGATTTGTATPAHTYAAPGTYQVMCYVEDADSSKAANVKFAWITVSAAQSAAPDPPTGLRVTAPAR